MRLFVLFLLFAAPAFSAAQEEEVDPVTRAQNDVNTGFHGLSQAIRDPAMFSDIMESMKDPEIMAEAQKMMADPEFQAQMRAFTDRPGFKEAATKVKEQFDALSQDPAKLKALTDEVENFLDGARDGSAEALRRKARNMAAQELSGEADSEGSNQALLGLEALKAANKDPKLMAEAMEQMKDPRIMREVKKLMSDPSFADQIRQFAGTPDFRATLEESAEMMKDLL